MGFFEDNLSGVEEENRASSSSSGSESDAVGDDPTLDESVVLSPAPTRPERERRPPARYGDFDMS